MDTPGVDMWEWAEGWTPGPRRGRSRRRRELWDLATTLLGGYLDVTAAELAARGLSVTAMRMGAGPDLEACLEVAAAETPVEIELAWAEDIGWSVCHRPLGALTTVWRYLHIDLAPAPATVARFVASTLADAEYVGMPYPAQFRLRGQPIRQVIEALTPYGGPAPRHEPPPVSVPSAG